MSVEAPRPPNLLLGDGDERIALSEVISALSFALDLTEDAVPGHALRTCLIGMRIASEVGLTDSDLHDLYYSLLLKDIGCSSNAARMCQILSADDRGAKRRVKTVDWTKASFDGLKLAWVNSLPEAGKLQKAFRVVELGLGRERNNAEMIGLRCERGADIVRKIGLGENCADAIHALDEHWNGSGYPMKLKGDAQPVLARIMGLAQHLDVFASEQSRPRALATMVERSGSWFDPELVRIAASLYRSGELWEGCETNADGAVEARTRVMAMEPGEVRILHSEQIDTLCEAFADVVDAKSPFTYRHSIGVTAAADHLSKFFDIPVEERVLIHRAALLHDLGKLSVSNMILDKPGKLDAEEWRAVLAHPVLSQQILARISSFAPIATIAGRHHEKLDGSGYPHGISAESLSLHDRIVTMADMYGALAEDRPYRSALAPDEILAIIRKQVPDKLDPGCFEALLAFLDLDLPDNVRLPESVET